MQLLCRVVFKRERRFGSKAGLLFHLEFHLGSNLQAVPRKQRGILLIWENRKPQHATVPNVE